MKKKYLSLAAFIILLSTSVNLNAANPTSVSTDINSISAIDAIAPSSVGITHDLASMTVRLATLEILGEDPFEWGVDVKFSDQGADSLSAFEMGSFVEDNLELFYLRESERDKLYYEFCTGSFISVTDYVRELIDRYKN